MKNRAFRGLYCVIVLSALVLSSLDIIATNDMNTEKKNPSLIQKEEYSYNNPPITDIPSGKDELLTPSYNESLYKSPSISAHNPKTDQKNEDYYLKIEPGLFESLKSKGSDKVIITSTNLNEVRKVLGIENQGYEPQNKKCETRLETSIFEIDCPMLQKLSSLGSVISIQSYRLPEPPEFPEDINDGTEPAMWNAVKYHGADIAWDLGFNGSGVKVAVLDTGVDFGHPDLNGTQARDENPSSPYYGWPLAFDSRSMLSYLSSGGKGFNGSGGEDNWFSDTGSIDTDSNGNGTLDNSSYNVSSIISQSGIYHLGIHPDKMLRDIYGNYLAVLVVDENSPGEYDTVYVDLDNDNNFTDEKPCRKWDEVSVHDLTGDGTQDRSGGMIYFIADGINPVPYSDIIAAENGYSLPIPENGSLVAFMINDPFDSIAGNHGTLCASAVTGQGIIASGRVKGTAPKAKIISVGNIYRGGNFLDSYYFAVEGYDGIPGTGDEANIVSCSFGDSEVIHGGWDFESRFIDNLTTNYAPNVTFSIASGNGGYGYGTVASPGSSCGVVTVGAALNKQITEVVYWSNRGPNALGQIDPDIVSVGVDAYGDLALNQRDDGNSAYRTWSGTSLATPVAAGIIALIYDAYFQSNGEHPTSELAREIIMSTADNLNYDPLVQGAGFANATRATKVANKISGILLSPSFWSAGSYRGLDYDAFAHIMHPEETDNITVSVSNADQNSTLDVLISDYTLSLTNTNTVSIDSNKSRLESSTSRPDYFITLHDSLNNISHIPTDTALLKVSGYMPWDEFDPDFDYSQENRFWITIYNWNDNNGNNTYWNDTNSDGVAQESEIEWGEFSEICSSSIIATTQEARMHDPLSRIDDGLIVGVFHNVIDDLITPEISHISIQSQCYNRSDWGWLNTDTSYLSIEAGGKTTFNATLTVPMSTPLGIYEGMISLYDTRNETVMPVIVNVASNSAEFEFGGNTLLSDLYSNDQVYGAFRWGWRYEGGDWRFYFTDIPDSFDVKPGTKLVADVKWENYPTDIDVFLLGGVKDTYSNDNPNRYGPYSLDITGSSADHYMWSGKFRFNTTTGTTHEIIAADLRPGLNEIILHNVLYSGMWFWENLTGNIGTINVTPYPWDVGLIDNMANLTGNQQFELLSSFNLSAIDVKAYGVFPPMEYPNQLVYQNVPSDKTTANWSKEFDVNSAEYVKVNISSENPIDIDLFILRDGNGNNQPDWGSEQVAESTSPYADEEIILDLPSDGKYWVFVHGWNIPSGVSNFDCYIEVVYGNDIDITDVHSGPIFSGEPVFFNASYNLPPTAGEYRGVIIIGLTNLSDIITVPFLARLEEEIPIITDLQPEDGIWINSNQPNISAQYYDLGSGINTSRVHIYLDGMNQTDNATITLSSINFTLMSSLSEGNHTVNLTVADNFGNQNFTSWVFYIDTINPIAEAQDDKIVNEDDIINFNGSMSWDENGIYNFTWDFGDGSLGYGTNPEYGYPQSGVYNVTLIVRDFAGNSGVDNLTVYVNNMAPVADAGGNQSTWEGENVFFDGSSSYDTPSDIPTLTYTWYFEDGTIITGITVDHVFEDNGIFNVTLVVEDNDGAWNSDIISVTVNNLPPTANTNGPYFGSEGVAITFTGSATDPGNDTLIFEWDFDASNGLTYTDAKGINPTWIWPDDFSGTIYLRVTDDDGAWSINATSVTIINENPQADANGPYTQDEGSLFTLIGSATDLGSDTFTYGWDLDNDGFYDDKTGQEIMWGWNDDGEYIIGFMVIDDDGGFGTDTVTVTIVNVAPIANIRGLLYGNEGLPLDFIGGQTDPGTDTFSYQWDFGDGGESTQKDPAHIYSDDGEYTVILTVTDDDGGVGTDTVTVIIYNSPPIIENVEGVLTAKEDQRFFFKINATDVENDEITFYDSSDLFDIGPTSGIIDFTPTNDDIGIYEVIIIASDEEGGTATITVLINITNENDPPVLEDIGPQNAIINEQFSLSVHAFDIDVNDILIFSDDSELFDIDQETGTITFTPEKDEIGVYYINISVTDSQGESDSKTMFLEIVDLYDDKKDSETSWFSFLVLILIIILLLIILMFILMRKREREEEKEGDKAQEHEVSEEDKLQFSTNENEEKALPQSDIIEESSNIEDLEDD